MDIRYKNFFFQILYCGKDYIDEPYKFISLDFLYLNCYSPYSTLKKCYYNNYLNIELDIYWRRWIISFGIIKQVDYEFGLEKFKEMRNKWTKDN